MTCAEAREAMLEAEPSELRGTGPGELARHLSDCAACAERARAILAGMEALDASLGAMAAAPGRRRPERRRSATRRLLPLGLAGAAVLAGILLVRRQPGAPTGPELAPAHAALPRGVELDLAASPRSAVVFETADSTITVVWYF